jgi:methylthioribose-1-phosphate isomerase
MTVPIAWRDDTLELLDQTLLPREERVLRCTTPEDVADAIRRLAVRGAPAIGVAAAYGVVLGGRERLDEVVELLAATRPTAVNLRWALERMRRAPGSLVDEADAIFADQVERDQRLCSLGAELVGAGERVLTHCNTGALACGGTGSALAVAVELAERGDITVLACETRPLLQGARLTIWELRRAGIAHELLVDGAAAGLIRRGEVDAVIVGCDRVAANGDVANKVGTYAHALAARAAGIPFVVAGPTSTIDASIETGEEIVIEERDMDEVRHAGGALLTEAGTPCRNPAFDVTPAELVTALVTERGIASPVTTESVMALLASPGGT